MTKIDIFSGFLGAGKTTLIKKLIKEAFAGEKLVLIENEFGEIGIDGGFVKDAGILVNEMNSGCICCSLVGDFSAALQQVLAQYLPDRILIEPSGVGKLSDVLKAVKQVDSDNVKINTFTAVVDATKCKVYSKNFGEFYNDQIEHAACIVLSRTLDMSEDKLSAYVSLIREKNATASIITTPWDELDGAMILSTMEGDHTMDICLDDHSDEECPVCGQHHEEHHHHHHHHEHDHDHDNCPCCHSGEHHHPHHEHEGSHDHAHHHHHHADDVFSSWGAETVQRFSAEDIQHILNRLSDVDRFGTVLRAKGIVAGVGSDWIYFDYVPGEISVRTGGADVIGKVCVIGSNISETALQELFHIN